MNKKGTLPIAIMTAIFVFIVGFATLNLLLPEVDNFRTDMHCDDANNISDATKLLCLVGGIAIPYWILIILSISIGGIVAKFTI